jgi:hypothetical protein
MSVLLGEGWQSSSTHHGKQALPTRLHLVSCRMLSGFSKLLTTGSPEDGGP